MVRRVCRELGTQKEIIVINDEAHHASLPRRKPDGRTRAEKLTGEERKEAEGPRRRGPALDHRPGSGPRQDRRQGRLRPVGHAVLPARVPATRRARSFPWVVSDFSLIDAIECGIVKIPRVPVADDAMTGDYPTYRNLWVRIRDELPRKGRGTEAVSRRRPLLPQDLEGALQSLYGHYEQQYRGSGRPTRRGGPTAARRRCSSSSATTPTSASWSSTTSPATRRTRHTPTAQPVVAPGQLRHLQQRATTSAGCTGPNTHPGRQPSSSNPARA